MTRTTRPGNRKKPGPKGYFKPKMIRDVFELARFGMTNNEIAEFLDIGVSTLEKYIRTYPEFKQALQKGRIRSSLKVVDSLYKRALGFNYIERHIEVRKNKFGAVVSKNIKKAERTILPNVTAAIYLLKVRHGDKWADVVKSEITKNINHNIKKLDVSELTHEERSMLKNIGLKNLSNLNNVTSN